MQNTNIHVDYAELTAQVKYKYKTVTNFAKIWGVSLTSMRKKLNGDVDLKHSEEVKFIELLGLDPVHAFNIFYAM